jgi:hypothetical protein
LQLMSARSGTRHAGDDLAEEFWRT